MSNRPLYLALVLGLLPLLLAGLPARAAELLMFEQRACEWCAVWNEEVGEVYAKTEEGRQAPLRRVDIHAPRPAGLEELRPVRYTPTFVVISRGRELGRIEGYPGEDHFWGLLQQILDKREGS